MKLDENAQLDTVVSVTNKPDPEGRTILTPLAKHRISASQARGIRRGAEEFLKPRP